MGREEDAAEWLWKGIGRKEVSCIFLAPCPVQFTNKAVPGRSSYLIIRTNI